MVGRDGGFVACSLEAADNAIAAGESNSLDLDSYKLAAVKPFFSKQSHSLQHRL